MVKEPYEFADLVSIKKREEELEEREAKIRKIVFKICSKCGEKKPVSKFSVDKRNIDGRIKICKACRCRQSLKHYYENREEILIKIKEYQDTRDRKIYFQNYRIEHEKHLKKIAGKWYKKNRKRIKKKNLKHKANLK